MVFTEIFSAVPGIGHGLAACKYLSGDRWAAREAFNAANRSTAVMAGGAAGILLGPAGVIAGAAAAGATYDTVDSIASGRPQGVISGIDDIATSIEKGSIKDGAKAVLKTGLCIGADAIGGVGGGAIAANIPKEMGKSLLKDAVKTIAKTSVKHTVLAPVTSHVLHSGASNIDSPSTSSGGHSSGGGGSSSSGGGSASSSSSSTNRGSTSSSTSTPSAQSSGAPQQPGRNPSQPSGHQTETQPQPQEYLIEFLAIFGVSSLDQACINGVYLFREITAPGNRSRRNYLKRLIEQLKRNKILKDVVKMVAEEIMILMENGDITFINFVNLCEFCARYITERAANLNEVQRDRSDVQDLQPYNERQLRYIRLVEQEITESGLRDSITQEVVRPGGPYGAVTIVRQLKTEMQRFVNMEPRFHNEIAAWTHYFKHRVAPGTEEVLSVSDYMGLIYSNLNRINTLPEYLDLTASPPRRQRLAYDIVMSRFGLRRFRIILKIQDGKLVIASGHILDVPIAGDQDGEEFFNADTEGPRNNRIVRRQ